MNEPPTTDRSTAHTQPTHIEPQSSATLSVNDASTGEVDAPAIPGYEVFGELGRGGMGAVFKARHRVLHRHVALKVLLDAEQAGPRAVARLRTEAEAIARLQHPNIVQIYEVGEWRSSADAPTVPYLALEYCNAGSLAGRLAGTPLPPREAAEIVERLARAMQAAHSLGVVHRDLKPANVLLHRVEGEPNQPKIADFGLAKTLDHDAGTTRAGAVMGTPSYMAPEQARGDSRLAGPPADIWALGAILYECLTGRPPFKAATPVDTIFQVLHDEPVPPSRLAARLPRDLETIVLKCLQKDSARRYPSAAELADDLRRFLDGRPILARSSTSLERLARWCRRNPVVASLLALVLLLSTSGTVIATLLYWQARSQADRADREAETARESSRQEALARQRAEASNRLARDRLNQLEWLAYAGQLDRVSALIQTGRPVDALTVLDATPWNCRGCEYRYLRLRCDPAEQILWPDLGPLQSLALADDGRFVVGNTQGVVALFDADGHERLRWAVHDPSQAVWINALAVAGDRVVTASSDNTLHVWDISNGPPVRPGRTLRGLIASVGGTSVTRDARWAAAVATDGHVKVWNLTTGELIRSLALGPIGAVALSDDGVLLATAGVGAPRVWDVAKGMEQTRLQGDPDRISRLAFGPRGQTLWAVSADKTILGWTLANGQSLPPRPGTALGLALTHDTLISVGVDGVRVEPVGAGQAEGYLGHQGAVAAVALASDARSFLTVGRDGTIRRWAVQPPRATSTFRVAAPVNALAIHPDSQHLLLGFGREDGPGTVRVVDRQGRERAALTGPKANVLALAWDAKGQRAATACQDGTVWLFDARTGKPLRTWEAHTDAALSVAFSPDGLLIASAGIDQTVKLWDTHTGNAIATLRGHRDLIGSLAFSPDGTRLATGSDDCTVRLWDVERHREAAILTGHAKRVQVVAYSSSGVLATASADGLIKLWDDRDERERVTLTGPSGPVNALAWTPDGSRVAAITADRRLRLWQAETGQILFVWPEPVQDGRAVAMSPDGSWLAVAGEDGTVRIWDSPRDPRPLSLRASASPLNGLALAPDGTALATIGADRVVRVWDMSTGRAHAAWAWGRNALSAVAYHPEHAHLLTGGGDRESVLRLWDVTTHRLLASGQSQAGGIRAIAYADQGQRIVSTAQDGTVRVWSARTLQPERELNGHRGAVHAVASSGPCLATGGHDGTIRLWDLATEKALNQYAAQAVVWSLAFSPDGSVLASGDANGVVRLWASRDESRAFTGHRGPVRALVWTADGTMLLSGGDDGTVRLWEADSGREQQRYRLTGRVTGVASEPRTGRILAATDEGTIRIWER